MYLSTSRLWPIWMNWIGRGAPEVPDTLRCLPAGSARPFYLGATALGLGCRGIGALYDSEAKDLIDLNPESSLLYLVASGPVGRF